MAYYDLDDILADGEKVPCRFNLTVPGLGYLEGNPGKPVQKDAKVELPMWLAEVLAVCVILEDSQESFIELMEPDFNLAKVRNAIRADPRSVDLHSIMGHYYRMAEKWARMFNEAPLARLAMGMLKERALEIDNYASNANRHVNAAFLYSLDEYEKALFRATNESKKEMRVWNTE